MTAALPPPIPGSAVGPAVPTAPARPAAPPLGTLPLSAAIGAIAVLTASLLVSKYLLDALVDLGWPVAVYVALLAVGGYGPSLWWCRYASRRWGTGSLRRDIGLEPRLVDLAWGPLVWVAAIAAQIGVAAIVLALRLPLAGNTEGLEDLGADRTYVVSLVIAAVIAAPIVEEMVFRGVVMRGLGSRLPVGAVVVVQGVLFGVAHVDPVRGSGNVGLVLVLSGVGIVLGGAVVLLGRIGPAIVAHALFNGVVLLIVLSGVADRLDVSASSPLEEVVVVDEAHIAEPGGDRDAGSPGTSVGFGESFEGVQGRGVEHGDVVECCERLGLDDRDRCADRVGDLGVR